MLNNVSLIADIKRVTVSYSQKRVQISIKPIAGQLQNIYDAFRYRGTYERWMCFGDKPVSDPTQKHIVTPDRKINSARHRVWFEQTKYIYRVRVSSVMSTRNALPACTVWNRSEFIQVRIQKIYQRQFIAFNLPLFVQNKKYMEAAGIIYSCVYSVFIV